MTEKEKAKAYDKAIERAKKWHNIPNPIYCNIITEKIFPELKENEDEEIRKEIISILRNAYWTSNRNRFNKLIAWLEKQRKPKSYWKPTEEQYEALDYAYNSCPDTERGNYYEGVLETLIEDLHMLEKQGKQASSQTNERAWLYLVSDVLTWKDGIGQYLDDPIVQKLAKRLCSEYAQKLYNPSNTGKDGRKEMANRTDGASVNVNG